MNQKSSRVILTQIGEDKVGIIANVPAVRRGADGAQRA
jgi:hypothetical protein